ncbi:heterokaryon incompatibility protein-domain-containing protein [Rostrohypoxylon terebratum]|nr:heterokaryon incompatibility protein-domain-containing protein [Rostrohypoxylon terebratum]
MNSGALLLANNSSLTEQRFGEKAGSLLRALLDEDQLLQINLDHKLPSLTYKDGFKIVGEESGLSPPITLCEPCRKLMQNPPPYYPDAYEYLNDLDSLPNLNPGFWVPFHTSISQLIACCHSSEGVCRICHFFWDILCKILAGKVNDNVYGKDDLGDLIARRTDWFEGGLSVCLYTLNEEWSLILDLGIPHRFKYQCHVNFRLQIFDNYINDRNSIVYGEDPSLGLNTSTDSPAALSQIDGWIKSCQRGHPNCRPLIERGGRPTRLVNIEDGGTMFSIKDRLQEDVEYVAISYRWGLNNTGYMLTKHTYETMSRKKSIRELPRTLRDVCSIAHRLGFKYVWIDRLCIIQGCDEDWNREAAAMAMVYTQSSLTIAASCALDEEDGCIRERNPFRTMALRLKSCPLLPGDNIVIRKQEPHLAETASDRKLGHLAGRGWVFQEWLLSTRVIHFETDQVYWECRQLDACESVPGGTANKCWKRLRISRPSLDMTRAAETWQNLIKKYSTREFTHDKDKLSAISGLAKAVRELTRDQLGLYYAGLWQSDFMMWLCWQVQSDLDTPPWTNPREFTAPSWSWASVNAEVNFYVLSFYGESPESFAYVAELRDIHLTHAVEDDPYTAIQDGWITISGHVRPVQAQLLPEDRTWIRAEMVDLDFATFSFVGLSLAHIQWDLVWPSADQFPGPFYYLPLLTRDTVNARTVYGLLLVHHGSYECNRTRSSGPHIPGAYERAGHVSMLVQKSDWGEFEDWILKSPKEDIVIR